MWRGKIILIKRQARGKTGLRQSGQENKGKIVFAVTYFLLTEWRVFLDDPLIVKGSVTGELFVDWLDEPLPRGPLSSHHRQLQHP